jgi:Ser/Thr protein kinase RdoA (MazF antagonist)
VECPFCEGYLCKKHKVIDCQDCYIDEKISELQPLLNRLQKHSNKAQAIADLQQVWSDFIETEKNERETLFLLTVARLQHRFYSDPRLAHHFTQEEITVFQLFGCYSCAGQKEIPDELAEKLPEEIRSLIKTKLYVALWVSSDMSGRNLNSDTYHLCQTLQALSQPHENFVPIGTFPNLDEKLMQCYFFPVPEIES